uniref:orotate phosphoribosyltransferase n=1 Tax=Chromera velia CCMP2878 TaxID=1169474 RepID=A0A0G4G774_9ALVE|mmetsp:Transcript_35993/g.70819  ORF Transcript_35993/g.70819 Transcript_35993/m.70819 type:complete len:217 (+) Transcript_35993:112-762(+)|eukprot:Cvel_20544.t1-p1 / transcript=Cvel_20544.t1 / gene=Cvel_20544 / organism=Chromera_velia_CCMP2878 / gene_product=Orotate phosphoribosyltransferase, putative / transcript_product=Orotate phosphoribosyltransferase, putative / location=Cvel_scaffold1854:3787-5820(-) / protein_length=216 / sequence_SO=supercontig / SO=protein_coding / is_pseudo=false
MEEWRLRFLEFAVRREALKFGEFTLKSGRKSPYFFNAGSFNTGDDLLEVGRAYAQAIVDSKIEFDVLFGPAYKGIPLAAAAALALAQFHGKSFPYAFNRKEAKGHGDKGLIVGFPLTPGCKVLVLDDVITAGTAIRETTELMKSLECEIAGVVISLDRQEKGATSDLSAIAEVKRDFGVPVVSMINLAHLIEYAKGKSEFAEVAPKMDAYRKEYGA